MNFKLVILDKQKFYSFLVIFFTILCVVLCIRNIQSSSKISKEEKEDPVAKYFAEQKIVIESETKKLQSKIDSLYLKLQQNNIKLDKLSKQKTQIKYVYITEMQKINALNNDGIIKEFNSFFSKNNSGQ